MIGLMAAVAAGVAGALLLGPHARMATGPRTTASVTSAPDDEALVRRLRPVLALSIVLGCWLLLGGLLGLLAGVVAGALGWRLLGGAESPAARRRREEVERDLPLAVDLLASCLVSGSSVEAGLAVVAAAVDGALGQRLGVVLHQLALGVDPATVWRELATDPAFGPLGRALARSQESGASVVGTVEGLAADLREQRRTEQQVRAKAVEVRATAPLGVCFLPAFLLIGVVPLVAGAVASLALFQR